MAYRFQFWIELLVKAISYFSSYLMIWLLLARFKEIDTWSIPEVMVLWALAQLAYTLAAPYFYHSIGKLDRHIVQGTYENLIVQPMPPLLNLIARNLSWTYSSQIILNAVVLAIALDRSGFVPTPDKLLYLALTIIGGMGFQSFSFLLGGSMSFKWLNSGMTIGRSFHWLGTNLTQYPISIYPAALRWLLTFIIPAALLNYYPTMYLLGRSDMTLPLVIYWIAPIALITLGASSFWMYRRAERSYQGSGG